MKKTKIRRVRQEEEYLRMIRAFRERERAGTRFTLEGKALGPKKLAETFMVCESGTYMGDYIWDEKGNLSEIRYNKVSDD